MSTAAQDPLSFLLRVSQDGDVVQFPTAFGALYLVNHPESIHTVLHSSKSIRVSMLKMGLGEGLLTSEGSYWARSVGACSRRFTNGASNL